MIKSSDVASVCVTYNPDLLNLANNIETNRKQVSRMILIDNSDDINTQNAIKLICKKYKECSCITLGENKGIAFALNYGCNIAVSEGYAWILTLDQDSSLPIGFIEGYLRYCNSLGSEEFSRVGMLTCNMSTWGNHSELNVEKVSICWTSGAFMRSIAYQDAGGFDSDLFIDCVDFDICAKIIKLGYEIIRINNICLTHNLGNTKAYKIFGRTLFYITNHNPLRRYYMTRNGLFLSKKYSDDFPSLKLGKIGILKIILKILCFESNKLKKFKAVRIGCSDFKRSKFGKCEHKF